MNKILEVSKFLNWQSTSRLKIEFSGNGAFLGNLVSLPELELEVAINSITLSDVSNTIEEAYISNKWTFTTLKESPFTLSVTFKDYNNYKLYKTFIQANKNFKNEYPDDTKMNIKVLVTPTFQIQDYKTLLIYKDCFLESISAPSLDVTATASIAEFTVSFKCSKIELEESPSILDKLLDLL